MKEIFVDGVHNLEFGRGVVRLDLGSLSAERVDKNGTPELEPRLRLLMTLEGFLELNAAMTEMLDRFVDAGMLRKDDINARTSGRDSDTSGAGAEDDNSPRSPNFG
jgi:hypothetical protein